jgi:hypothetical protein
MVVRGLISFGVGGAFLLLAFTEIFASSALYYDPFPVVLQSVILGFLSFLLIGFGLYLILKETRQEKPKQTPPQQ